MTRLRYRIGRALLRPYLIHELRSAALYHDAAERRNENERYWLGRWTAVRRILKGES